MATLKYEVAPLFAEPYFRTNISDAISKDQIKFIKNLEMVSNQQNKISENLYIFNEPELASIAKAVQEALDVYAAEVMGIKQKIVPTQSWALTNEPGIGMHGHSHSNSIVSGSLYYCDLPQPVANMIFDRHRSYQQLQLDPAHDKQNIFNARMNVVTPKKGDLVLFSSGLQHFVEPNQSNQTRYSIAFNTFIRGRLGDYRDVSELFIS